MPVSKAQQKSVHKYVKNNYDRMELTVPKGRKAIIQAAAATAGESVNAYINGAITQRMERDTPGSPSEATGAALGAGVVSLPSDTLEAAQRAAETAGETVSEWITGAVSDRL